MSDMNDGEGPTVQHVYDFATLDRAPAGPTSLKVIQRRVSSGPGVANSRVSTGGAVLSGEHIVCTLGHQARGTGAHPHTQPSEQFNYILQGTMMSDIEGDRAFAPRGSMLHTPGGMLRTGLACPDEDLVFLAIRDTRQAPTDASAERNFAPNAFGGFGSRAEEPRQTLAQILEEAASLPPGPGTRYVYDMHADTDAWGGVSSAEVTADAALRLPPGIRGKLVSGEHLHVGVFRFDPGATLHNYRHHNEQLVFTVEGELEVRIDEENVSVNRRCMLHVPPGTRHELYAPEGAIVLIAQDKRRPDAPAGPG